MATYEQLSAADKAAMAAAKAGASNADISQAAKTGTYGTTNYAAPITPPPIVKTDYNANGLTSETGINTNNIQPNADLLNTSRQRADQAATEANNVNAQIDTLREQQKELLGTTAFDVSKERQNLISGSRISEYQAQIDALQPQMATLTTKIADLDAAEANAIAGLVNKATTNAFSMGMEGRIQRQYAAQRSGYSAQLNALTAQANMYQGNIDKANESIDKTIQDMKDTAQMKVDDMKRLYSYYGDVISSLDKKQQTLLQQKYTDLVADEQRIQNEGDAKKALINELMNAGAVIDMSDFSTASYEELSRRGAEAMAKVQAQKDAQALALVNEKATTDTKALNTLRNQAKSDAYVKIFPDVEQAYNGAASAAKMGNSAGDLVLMRYIAKITDPTTGVREEEYRTFTGAQGDLQRLGVYVTKDMIGRGKLTDAGRAQLLQVATDKYNIAKSQYDNSMNFYKDQAIKLGINPNDILPNYSTITTGSVGTNNNDPLGIR